MPDLRVGPAIKKYMKEHGIKQRFLASKMNIAESTLGQKLKGITKIDMDEFLLICEILDVPYDTFLQKIEKKEA